MTRPKVDPDKRQRTAQACDSCKRRKQKCNGLKPCSTCMKRSLECLYTPTSLEPGSQEPIGSPTKRRHVDSSPGTLKSTLESSQTIATHAPSLASWNQPTNRVAMGLVETEPAEIGQKKSMGATRQLLGTSDRDFDSRSRMSNTSGAADEAELMSLPRMLMDTTTRRLLYVGESASLSYLQLIRMIVESVSGTSDFTLDPQRHNILENSIPIPYEIRPTGVLPDRKTADILIDSFFTNTSGFIEVFNQKEFLESVEECYNEPLGTSQSLLCLLNLVFAIGLVIARPLQGTDESIVIQNLHSEPVNRAELFFRNAKTLYNPDSGFEDGDFWAIQAQLLMSLYMLAVSKRNSSYVYNGMAVRLAVSLGLHREESMVIFNAAERRLRRNVWRSLFVLDRFLAACLGRPITISEDDCSEHALEQPIEPSADESADNGGAEPTNSVALDAAVRSCSLIGLTLKKVYSKRKVSTLVAQEIADHLEKWERELNQNLDCRRIVDGGVDASQAVAILHIHLLHCHSVLLLTRPFFLYLLKMCCDDLSRNSHKSPHCSPRLEKFSRACVEASQRTIILVRAALDAEYLPHCNPFIIYFVFAAALIILSNEFASLYHNPDAENSIRSALLILSWCGQMDAQAKRVSYIIETFHHANIDRPPTAKKIYLPGRKIPTISTVSQTFEQHPMSPFFRSVKAERHDIYMPDMSPTKERQMVNIPTAVSESSMCPMMPPTLQQPSPEGSVSLNSGIAAASMGPSIESLNGEPEFDFDTLWQGWPPPAGNGMGIPPQLHPAEPFGSYGLHQPTMPQGNGLNQYPPSEFR